MGVTMLIGALFAICGTVLLAIEAINRGKLSDSHSDPEQKQTRPIEAGGKEAYATTQRLERTSRYRSVQSLY
jgi:hypothetical protein